MNILTGLIKEDMKVSLGVTEPGAIALAVSKARSLTQGEITSVDVKVNSCIYKNAFTCGIPNTRETGNLFAAALGAVAGKWEKGLASLDGTTSEDIQAAKKIIGEGKVKVDLHEISTKLYIKAVVATGTDKTEVTITDSHANISRVVQNGKAMFEQKEKKTEENEKNSGDITAYTLADFWEYANTVDTKEIEFIKDAYAVNISLMNEGADCEYTTICKYMIAQNGGALFSDDEQKTAHAITSSAIEARVRGLNRPAMSITGSGNHGIISTMPLYACYKTERLSEEKLIRATALSYLVTMYIKQYSGALSAFCGCAIAAGTGMSVGLLFMNGGTLKQASYVINNMASSLTGIICTGGNPACVLKAAIAIDIGYKSVNLALENVSVEEKHGINGWTPEQTMRNIGHIASPGMVYTENTIMDILKEKT